MAHHVIAMADGSVAVMETLDGATVEDCIAKWHPDSQAQVVAHCPINPDAVPRDRDFRDAWTHDGTTFGHDMGKARQIHRDRLRASRASRLEALDVAYQRADESGDEVGKLRVRNRKQKLRDAPAHPLIEAAQTVDDLTTLTLERLCA